MTLKLLLRRDVSTAIKRSARQHGKHFEPPEALKALDKLRIKQGTIALSFESEPHMNVKSYQVSEWLRGTARCPEKYHGHLVRLLMQTVNEADKLLGEAKQTGLYPLKALEAYRADVRDAEAVLQALNSQQGKLV